MEMGSLGRIIDCALWEFVRKKKGQIWTMNVIVSGDRRASQYDAPTDVDSFGDDTRMMWCIMHYDTV